MKNNIIISIGCAGSICAKLWIVSGLTVVWYWIPFLALVNILIQKNEIK